MVILSGGEGAKKNPIRWQMQTGALANKKDRSVCIFGMSDFFNCFLCVCVCVILYLFIYHHLSDHADGVDFPPIILAKCWPLVHD